MVWVGGLGFSGLGFDDSGYPLEKQSLSFSGIPIGIQSTGPQANTLLNETAAILAPKLRLQEKWISITLPNTLDDKTTFWGVEVGKKTPWFYIW